jgi:hypothetical protein
VASVSSVSSAVESFAQRSLVRALASKLQSPRT